MNIETLSAGLRTLGLAVSLALTCGGLAQAQVVNLSAGARTAVLPDGQQVPMWGYSCGAVDVNANGATCAAANAAAGANWAPVVITVPYSVSGTNLTINLTNNLFFGAAAKQQIPTSMVIVGQLGGGLGTAPVRTPSPVHQPLELSWPAAGDSGNGDPVFTPPSQPDRVRSFGTEVPACDASTTCSATALVWNNLRPGTYLIHSGTQPSIQSPMGLYGVLVVTDPAGTAYPGVTYKADLPLVFSEIDPLQNAAVAQAVATAGFDPQAVWSGQTGACGDPAVHTCYPPAVNYDPRYFLINGVSFDRSSAGNSLFAAAPASGVTVPFAGSVLVRLVNAGLRMHVPTIVGAQTGAAAGLAMVAEDGNRLPGNPRVQNQVFLAAGKTVDVLINAPASGTTALPVFDRQLSLSTNNQRDGGMQGYVSINGAALPAAAITQTQGGTPTTMTAQAVADSYFRTPGGTLAVAEAARGVMANDIGISGVKLLTAPTKGTLTLNANGSFTYVSDGTDVADSFVYCGNGATSGALCTTVTLKPCSGDASCDAGPPTANADSYTSRIASLFQQRAPGVLENDVDPKGLKLKSALVGSPSGGSVTLNDDGSFVATRTCSAPCTLTFNYSATNSQGKAANAAVTVNFPAPSGLNVAVKDAKNGAAITDYRWIIEEDRSFHVDPKCQVNTMPRPLDSKGQPCPPLPVPSQGTNFHTSHMPVVAQGCVGPKSCEEGQTLLGAAAVCDVGNGQCRTDGAQRTAVLPSQAVLDPMKRYYISILPGDGVNPTLGGAGGAMQVDESCDPNTTSCAMRQFDIVKDCGAFNPAAGTKWEPGGANALCGHAMGGAQIAAGQTSASIALQQTPLPTAKIVVFVFQDDNPLNGENDAGGGVDALAPNEAGLGGFNLVLLDQAGALGDSTGQITYDMFNQPVTNALAHTIDPLTGKDACPISPPSGDGMVGIIVTCPKYESDGTTLSPLAGQALIANLYPGLYEVVANPGADRVARGEEWLQTSTLDGTKAIEAFIRAGEPAYFQEFGPGGYHVAVGFANPGIIRARKGTLNDGLGLVCSSASAKCNATVNGQVTNLRLSRTPDQRVYSSGNYAHYSFTQCYASIGAPDGIDFDFAKCDGEGKFTFNNIPLGNWRITIFDQWNDLLVDGLSTPVVVGGSAQCTAGNAPVCSYELPITQWRTNLYTRTFLDLNGDGVSQESEPGLPLVSTNIRYRDGSIGFFNNTDMNGYAGFNEVFPFLNWLVVDPYTTRYKLTGVHVVYDAGGAVDGTTGGGSSAIADHLANTTESATAHVPTLLRTPGTRYCKSADCPPGDPGFVPDSTVTYDANGNVTSVTPGQAGSTGRVDPPWAATQGWQGLLGQNSFIEFGMKPFANGENGGVNGHVLYASTRPFDDPALLLQLSWGPGIPNVKVNLYKSGTAADGSPTLTLVDTTTTTSFDDWAQGFHLGPDGTTMVPNMNCPGLEAQDNMFFFTVKDSRQFLNPNVPIPKDSRFKCFDGWAVLNHVQPAPYDGMYSFPSVTKRDPVTGKGAGTNCTGCVPNPDASDSFRAGQPMLPPGKYVVEVVMPPGYELVKEEDKNILLGDVYVAPVTQQFAGFGNIFILPDQAAVNAFYNPTNRQNATTNLGALPRHEGDTGSVETFWPCVGAERIVPDYNSLYPGAQQSAPFAGAKRRLCDRKEVVLEDQMTALAKFYLFSSTHVSGRFTGTITNDFASEFDPFSPQFGEKFAVPNLPVAMRDFNGNEMGRVYSDQWGMYTGLNYSSYSVNPPNPTGYVPQMMIACMNDPGPVKDPATGQMVTDPLYNPAYSNYCYEIPFMPGQTAYLDTPVIPTMAFADGYNLPDCDYPDATPAIRRVDGAGTHKGPWVAAAGETLTIKALGDKQVLNHAYSGPSAKTAPYNAKFITRHYGFGGTQGTVTIGGVNAPVTGWTDSTITVTVPATVPNCALQQRGQPAAKCGQLVITAANGKSSIDAITVTVGGKPPTIVTPNSPSSTTFGATLPNPLQTAIDAATAGDLLIVEEGTYKEMLLMWKPLRLQGVGAAAVTLNADAHPAGRVDPWRRQVDCLFGLSLQGRPLSVPGQAGDDFDASGIYTCPASMRHKVDRIPFEAIVGWDTSGNGNLAQLLQEPTLMGAYEGAGISVLGRGVRIPANSTDFWGAAAAGGFPAGYLYLTSSNGDCNPAVQGSDPARDYASSNFNCNPSRIDGISVVNSSQGGGAIFVHGWNHNLEIANTRITANHGTLTGGITVGSGEFPDPFIVGGDNPIPYPTGLLSLLPGAQAPYKFNVNVNVHHNAVTGNASIGDALYSGTPSAAGGVTFCTGADNYQFNYNWVCGNLSTGDGGGVVHSGFIDSGLISHNTVIFNQSTNPTIPTHGGGIAILAAAPDRTLANGQECGNTAADLDCAPGLSEGTGRNLVIDANLIVGNSAESGSGGGLRIQMLNGQDVAAFPRTPILWNSVTVTNNIIANNVAGWDGGGVSIQDALRMNFVNNTVVANDTTASAGVLFNTLGAPLSATPPPGCVVSTDPNNTLGLDCPPNPITTSTPQAAGLVSMAHTPNLIAAIAGAPGGTLACPLLNGSGSLTTTLGGPCNTWSNPYLANNLFWQNRAFHIEVGAFGAGQQSQQHLVALVPLLNQTLTGMCAAAGVDQLGNPASVGFWDVGVRGDTGPNNHGSGFTLSMANSILSNSNDPALLRQYCNGSRLPPENNGNRGGYNAPPGRSETTGLYPAFSLNNITPAATTDEGNNWINLGYGPLALVNPVDAVTVLGNFRIGSGSSAIGGGANQLSGVFPTLVRDFFGTARPTTLLGTVVQSDIGAVQYAALTGLSASVSPIVADFGSVALNVDSAAKTLTVHNNGSVTLNTLSITFAPGTPFARSTTSPGSCTAGGNLAAGATCTVNVVAHPTAAGAASGTVSFAFANAAVAGSPVQLASVGFVPFVSVSPSTLAFGNQAVGTTSSPAKTLTVSNSSATSTMSGVAVAATGPYTQTNNCGATLAPGATCTISVVFKPTALGAAAGTVSVTGSTIVSNSPVGLTGTGTMPALPTIAVIDNFNRANANTLGANWSQVVLLGSAAIRVNTNQAFDTLLPGTAFWNGTGATFGAKQGAAFTFASTTLDTASLTLKVTGGTASVPQNFVRVQYTTAGGGTVTVATTSNSGLTYTTAATFTGFGGFANGNVLSAMIDANGYVYVWKTAGATTSTVGITQLSGALWTSGNGRVGMQLPANARVDDFKGGTLP